MGSEDKPRTSQHEHRDGEVLPDPDDAGFRLESSKDWTATPEQIRAMSRIFSLRVPKPGK